MKRRLVMGVASAVLAAGTILAPTAAMAAPVQGPVLATDHHDHDKGRDHGRDCRRVWHKGHWTHVHHGWHWKKVWVPGYWTVKYHR